MTSNNCVALESVAVVSWSVKVMLKMVVEARREQDRGRSGMQVRGKQYGMDKCTAIVCECKGVFTQCQELFGGARRSLQQVYSFTSSTGATWALTTVTLCHRRSPAPRCCR
jgi:hypothetical protein